MENKTEKRERAATEYANVHAEKFRETKNPDFKLEYVISNAYKKGWDERGEEIESMKRYCKILNDILLNTMTSEQLYEIKHTYGVESKASDEMNKIHSQIILLEKQMDAKGRRVSKAVKKRKTLFELQKAKNAHDILNK